MKGHVWFASTEWDTLQQQTAPFVPPVAGRVDEIFNKLATTSDETHEFAKLIHEITANFDDFPDEPLPGFKEGRAGSSGGGGRRARRDPEFIGYTFKRHPKPKAAGAPKFDPSLLVHNADDALS